MVGVLEPVDVEGQLPAGVRRPPRLGHQLGLQYAYRMEKKEEKEKTAQERKRKTGWECMIFTFPNSEKFHFYLKLLFVFSFL